MPVNTFVKALLVQIYYSTEIHVLQEKCSGA